MKKRVILPKDELAHKNQAVEWWYFNGFLKGKKKDYAYMHCLFKVDRDKANLSFLKIPFKTIYFSHTILYDLTNKKIKREILPFVFVSKDSFKNNRLMVDYFYPIRKDFFNYEIAREAEKIRVKTDFFDLAMELKKSPLLENQTGFIKLKNKSTYYYSYSDLETRGFISGEEVYGKSWHDHQWSRKGFMRDSWLWFCFQLEQGTDIVCFDYKGKKLATILYSSGVQETCAVKFIPLGKKMKSKETGNIYELEWEIKIKDMVIRTRPIIKNCEIRFGRITYWEGPLKISIEGIKSENSQGFMEYLSPDKKGQLSELILNKLGIVEFFEKYSKNFFLPRD